VIAILVATIGARAASVADDVASAREAILRQDYRAALSALDAAEDRAPAEDGPVPGPVLAGIWYLRGVVASVQGDEAIHLWRQTLAVQNDLPWDTGLVPSGDERALFEALRKEVEDRGRVDVMAPEQTGLAKLFVDGRRVRAGDDAIVGQHLAQITCPDGVTRGRWTDFEKPFRWFRLCPDGVDTSVVVTEETAGGDDLGLLPVWKDDDAVDSAPDEAKPATESVARVERGGQGRTVILASGGALVAVGLALDLLWVVPTYAKVSDARDAPDTITRAEADERTASYRAARWTTIGVLGAGVVVVGSGFLLDVHPAGLGLAIDGAW
jgi:hypothetical protein